MKTISFLICSMVAAWIGAGCAAGPNYKPPPVAAPASFTGGADPSFTTNEPAAAWWRSFGDVELIQLVERAVASNWDLRIASDNLLQERALLLGAKADFLPVINGVAAYSNTKYSEAELFDATTSTRTQELYDVGFEAVWELDIFGRVRRATQAGAASVEASAALRQDLQISLVSEVARNYFELRGAQNEIAVLRRNADNQNQTLKITQARLEAGGGTELDVARARAELNNTLAEIAPMESAAAHATHRLGVLTGQTPESLGDELGAAQPMLVLPHLVAIGDPAALLRRRPDVRAAERNLAAATARIGVAVADLFPRVTFNGSIGLNAESFSGLGRAGSDTRSFGPSITWAALDYGHVRSRIKAAGAQANAALARYQKTVLTSLEETENALVDFGRAQNRAAFLAASVQASEAAAGLAQNRYDNGATDFLTLLDAQRVLLESQDQLAQTETQTSLALVAVYKALAGGWPEVSNAH